MITRILGPGDPKSDLKGRTAICTVSAQGRDFSRKTLASIDRFTAPELPLVMLAGAPSLALIESELGGSSRAVFAAGPRPKHGVAAALRAVQAATGCDLAIVSAGVVVDENWLERLQTAAHSDSTVVSATALSDRAGIFGVHASTPERAARGIPSYPRVATIGSHCCLLRKELIERVAALLDDGDDAGVVLNELAVRASSLGMLHVLADDVLTLGPTDSPQAGEPTLAPNLATPEARPPLRRAIMRVRTVERGRISVTVDARALASSPGGTQTYTADLIAALAGSGELSVRALVASDITAQTIARFKNLDVATISYEQATRRPPLSDVVHRPQQVFTVEDLQLLQLVGERIVIGQQDLIAYHIAAYHESERIWERYRRTTRLALELADRIVFFSEHALRDAVAEEIVAPERSDVIGIGADHPDQEPETIPEPVPYVDTHDGLLLCLGANYAHKNRPFAIALLDALHRRHGWRGRLVFAGPRVNHGSSAEEERHLLVDNPQIAPFVVDLGPVSNAQRRWLFEHSSAVVHPSTYEGFGLLPFEAYKHGLPCLFAPLTSLVEHAGERAATLIPWNAEHSADAAIELLRPSPARNRHLQLLREASESARWKDVVERLICCYQQALDQPYRASAPYAWQGVDHARIVAELEAVADRYRQDWESLEVNRYTALPLVASDGLLSQDEQRGLMRIASRPLLHNLLLGPVGLLGGVRARPLTEEAEHVHAKSSPGSRNSRPRG